MKHIGFIGVGIMGKSMVRNLMKHGYCVTIYTRTKSKVLDVIQEGAVWADSAAMAAKNQDAVITMVGFPNDVEEVYFKEDGIIENAAKGTYLIDMTTTTPKLAQRIYKEAKLRQLKAMDAPVTGGDTGAKNGTLTILAGGDQEDFMQCYELFSAMGKNIVYEGPAGYGQHTKMANQIMIAGAMSGVCEAISYAKKEGLNLDKLLASTSTGAASSTQLTAFGPKMVAGDFQPGFFMKHFVKDMKIAYEEAQEAGLELKMLPEVLSMYEELMKQDMGDLGTQALLKYYE